MKRFFRLSDSRPDPRRDVDDEIQFYLEMRARELVEKGMDPERARRAAAVAFGDVEEIAAECRSLRRDRARERQRRDWTRGFLMDVAYALRTLRKNPGFTLAAIATLTLGIGATTAVFTVVNGVLVRPLPYANPSSLAMVWLSGTDAQGLGSEMPLASGLFLDLESQATSFAGIAAFRSWPFTVAGDGPAEQVAGARISPSLFSLLGVRPAIGRTFTDDESRIGGPRAVIVSDGYWKRRFGGASSVLGQRVILSGEPFTIVGVMPRGFTFPRGAELPPGLQFPPRTDLWTPLVFSEADQRNYGTANLAAIARLRPGTSRAGAQTAITVALHRFLKANNFRTRLDYQVVGLVDQAGSRVQRSLLVLLGAVACVLLIACANVANLLIGRTAARQREFAVRAALGAGRVRIARQLVTENIVLATAGTTLGLLLSVWGTRAMLALVPGSMPRLDDVAIDWRVVAVAAGVAAIAGLAFGLGSAHHVGSPNLSASLYAAGGRTTAGTGRRLGRRLLVTAEVSLSLMLLIGAAQLIESFVRLQHVEPGFNPAHALVADVQLPLPGPFNPARDGPRWSAFFTQLMDRMRTGAAVRAVGGVSSMPLTGAEEGGRVAIAGRPAPASGLNPGVQYNVVSGDYFAAMGIALISGRAFDLHDASDGVQVIVVNREFAHRYLADSSALGRGLTTTFELSNVGPRTVVGVVDDVRQHSLDAPPVPQVYVPITQMPYPALTVVVRSDGDPAAILPLLRRTVKELDGTVALANVRTLDAVLGASMAPQRFSTAIIAVFAAAALVLAVVGLYGVIALSVGQRRREIGIRMALGAAGPDIAQLVLSEGARIVAAGIGLGMLGALAASRLLSTMLYDTSAAAPGLFMGAAIVIGLVSLAATYVPARRATHVDPTQTLRED